MPGVSLLSVDLVTLSTPEQTALLREKLNNKKQEWKQQQQQYMFLETKSNELRSVYRNLASRVEDLVRTVHENASREEAEQAIPAKFFRKAELDAFESQRAEAINILREERNKQASKWKSLVDAIQRERDLAVESLVLKHKEDVSTLLFAYSRF